jgi:Tfp pilus assembly protein PilF
MRRITIAAIIIILSPALCMAKKDKNKEKQEDQQNAIEKEDNNFSKKIARHPNDASVYLAHAQKLSSFKQDGAIIAKVRESYDSALHLDSMNGTIYKDYGNYLSTVAHNFEDAKIILSKGLKLLPSDEQMKKQLEGTEAILIAREADMKMRDVGHSSGRELDSNKNYKVYSNIDSLRKETENKGSSVYYPLLLERFNKNDKTLSAEDMYFLIIGYSTQSAYNPFNRNDLSSIQRALAKGLDTGITESLEILSLNPLNPSLNREMMYYYRKKGMAKQADDYLKRIQLYYSGILFSGNGTCAKPYLSLWGKEEYSFLNYINFKDTDIKSMELCNGQMVEQIQCENISSSKKENIYFNMKLIYSRLTTK